MNDINRPNAGGLFRLSDEELSLVLSFRDCCPAHQDIIRYVITCALTQCLKGDIPDNVVRLISGITGS